MPSPSRVRPRPSSSAAATQFNPEQLVPSPDLDLLRLSPLDWQHLRQPLAAWQQRARQQHLQQRELLRQLADVADHERLGVAASTLRTALIDGDWEQIERSLKNKSGWLVLRLLATLLSHHVGGGAV